MTFSRKAPIEHKEPFFTGSFVFFSFHCPWSGHTAGNWDGYGDSFSLCFWDGVERGVSGVSHQV